MKVIDFILSIILFYILLSIPSNTIIMIFNLDPWDEYLFVAPFFLIKIILTPIFKLIFFPFKYMFKLLKSITKIIEDN